MDIVNLNQTNPVNHTNSLLSLLVIPVICLVAIAAGFGLSRVFPSNSSSVANTSNPSKNTSGIVTNDSIKGENDIVVGKTYGNTDNTFKDTATGTIQKGALNGEGTHILVRDGGDSQRAALTSSVLDLDLFVGRKVEVRGQTNSSRKVAWLLDVGMIKVLE